MGKRGTTIVFKGKMAEAVLNALAGREVIKPNDRKGCFPPCGLCYAGQCAAVPHSQAETACGEKEKQ